MTVSFSRPALTDPLETEVSASALGAYLDLSDLGAVSRPPSIPDEVLRRHHAHVAGDTRFKAAARLLQAIWREDRDLPIGVSQGKGGAGREIGSSISMAAGRAGANFIHPAIAQLARRELIYREAGALYDDHRLLTNLLSSQALAFNLFGPMKLNLAIATAVIECLAPAFISRVTGVVFEHSPGRGSRLFSDDNTAFDVLIRGIGPDGQRRFIALEVKYSETGHEPSLRLSGRYDEIASTCGLFRDPMHPALWSGVLQQPFRQMCLAHSMIAQGLYDEGLHLFIAPEHNTQARQVASSFVQHLKSSDQGNLQFKALTLETVIDAIACVGSPAHAKALHRRYCDWWQVDAELNMEAASACDDAGFDYSPVFYRPLIAPEMERDADVSDAEEPASLDL